MSDKKNLQKDAKEDSSAAAASGGSAKPTSGGPMSPTSGEQKTSDRPSRSSEKKGPSSKAPAEGPLSVDAKMKEGEKEKRVSDEIRTGTIGTSHSVKDGSEEKGGAEKKVPTTQIGKIIDYSHVTSKVGSLDNIDHRASGGKVDLSDPDYHLVTRSSTLRSRSPSASSSARKSLPKETSTKMNLVNVSSEGKPVDNSGASKPTPGTGRSNSLEPKKKNPDEPMTFPKKVDTSQAKSKVGSLDNIDHKPGGGKVDLSDKDYHLSKQSSSKRSSSPGTDKESTTKNPLSPNAEGASKKDPKDKGLSMKD